MGKKKERKIVETLVEFNSSRNAKFFLEREESHTLDIFVSAWLLGKGNWIKCVAKERSSGRYRHAHADIIIAD